MYHTRLAPRGLVGATQTVEFESFVENSSFANSPFAETHSLTAACVHSFRSNHIFQFLFFFISHFYCADAIDKRPVFTKSVSSGLIGLLGDLLAQSVEWAIGGGAVPWSGTRVREPKLLGQETATCV